MISSSRSRPYHTAVRLSSKPTTAPCAGPCLSSGAAWLKTSRSSIARGNRQPLRSSMHCLGLATKTTRPPVVHVCRVSPRQVHALAPDAPARTTANPSTRRVTGSATIGLEHAPGCRHPRPTTFTLTAAPSGAEPVPSRCWSTWGTGFSRPREHGMNAREKAKKIVEMPQPARRRDERRGADACCRLFPQPTRTRHERRPPSLLTSTPRARGTSACRMFA